MSYLVVTRLEPYPDTLLDAAAIAPGPEARYGASESISLAFIAALQVLPSRQRAVLILRDVVGFTAAETADILDSTADSVTSALEQARATLRDRYAHARREPPVAANSRAERDLIAMLMAACPSYDLIPTRANGQLAFAAYLRDPAGGARRAVGLLVLTLSGDQICEITRFDNTVLASFGLPGVLP